MNWIGGAKAATTWQSDTVEVAKVAASLAWKAALARIAWLVLLDAEDDLGRGVRHDRR
jgi:hypothetical protein